MLLLWLCYYMCCIFVECVLVYLLRLVTISLLELDHLTYLVVAYVLMGVEIEVNKNKNYLQCIAVIFFIFTTIIF